MKHFLLLVLVFLSGINLFSESIKIVDYSIQTDYTKEEAIKNKVKLETDLVFNSTEELEKYIKSLEQNLLNTRAFDTVTITLDKINDLEESSDTINYTCFIKAKESKHILIVPYPKYESSNGLQFKLKAKDTNLFGTLNELNFDLTLGNKESELTEEKDFYIGAEFDFIYPIFYTPFLLNWNNAYKFEYNFADSRPQFSTQTGFTLEKPMNNYSYLFQVKQELNRCFEYIPFNDELYGKTYAKFSVPVKVWKNDNINNIYLIPFIDFDYNYDQNKIDINNDDLSGYVAAAGIELKTGKINWEGNFRKGFYFLTGTKEGYNYQCNNLQYKQYAELQYFYNNSIFGLASKISFNYSQKYRENIGYNVRGALDNQKYNNSIYKALKTPSSIVLNTDFPIHIIDTKWSEWIKNIFGEESWMAEHFSWTDTFNFELQLSPFIDVALTKNEATDRLFSYKDGWYTSGFEVLIYPSKWKSIVVRASAGFDIGKEIINKKNPGTLDYSWRNTKSSHEIYAGIGLLY